MRFEVSVVSTGVHLRPSRVAIQRYELILKILSIFHSLVREEDLPQIASNSSLRRVPFRSSIVPGQHTVSSICVVLFLSIPCTFFLKNRKYVLCARGSRVRRAREPKGLDNDQCHRLVGSNLDRSPTTPPPHPRIPKRFGQQLARGAGPQH